MSWREVKEASEVVREEGLSSEPCGRVWEATTTRPDSSRKLET